MFHVKAFLPCQGICNDHGSAFIVGTVGSHKRLKGFLRVILNDNSVHQRLLLHHEYSLNALDNEVSSRVIRTFACFDHFFLCFTTQGAKVTAQHHWQHSDFHITLADPAVSLPIDNIHQNWCSVSQISQATIVRSGVRHNHVFSLRRLSNSDALILQKPVLVRLTSHYIVAGCLDNLLHFDIHKVVVGINMLCHKPFVLKEEVHQSPFVKDGWGLLLFCLCLLMFHLCILLDLLLPWPLLSPPVSMLH
mmetsp:Transcript_30217/g.65179  ORF Transcript_30217/g.65179 Transcript_30217/m.65179 type:complete len:248 (+) Transcript_30217:2803-3546(+)